MKQYAGPEALVIPENTNKLKMNRYIILIVVAIQFLFASCGTSKVASKKTEKESANTEKNVDLPEDKRIEFEFLYIEGLKHKMLGNLDNAIQYFNNCL